MKYQVKLINGKILQVEVNSILDVIKLGEAVGEIEYIEWDALAVESSEWFHTRDFYEDCWWLPEFSPISCNKTDYRIPNLKSDLERFLSWHKSFFKKRKIFSRNYTP